MDISKSIESFWDSFKAQKEDIFKDIESAKNLSNFSTPQILFEKIKSLEIMLTQAQSYLPKYDLKTSSKIVQDLKSRTSELQKKTQSKPSFKLNLKSSLQSKKVNSSLVRESKPDIAMHLQTRIQGEYLISDPDNSTPNNEYSFESLTSCWVDLTDKPSIHALYASSLESCVVLCKIITGSVTIRNSNKCIFAFLSSAQQIRLESCVDTDIYLSCNTRPIIETSSGIRFCALTEPNANSTMDKNIDLNDNGLQVADFSWLKKQRSPNWSTFSGRDPGWVSPDQLVLYKHELRTHSHVNNNEDTSRISGISRTKTPAVLEMLNSLDFFKSSV